MAPDTRNLLGTGTLFMNGIEIGTVEEVKFTCNSEFNLFNGVKQNEVNAKKLEVNFQRAYEKMRE